MVAGITEWILSLNGALALTIVFAFTALEASAFVGFLFPGEIAVLLGGVLAFEGRVPLEAVIGVAIAGAVIGDSIGYAVGRRWGHQMLGTVGSRIPFVRHRIDEHLDSAKAFVKRRGGAAVFLGRSPTVAARRNRDQRWYVSTSNVFPFSSVGVIVTVAPSTRTRRKW